MFYSIGDSRTYYYEKDGQGIPVVLLHGFTGSTSTWSPFVSTWKDHFQLITVDLPGHGKTITSTPVTMKEICHDLKNLLQYLQLTKVHIIGYSMGGRTALSFAMLYPEWISSLVLESASPGLPSSEERIARVKKDENLARKIEEDGVLAFVKLWENVPLFSTQKKLPAAIQQSIREERLTHSKEGLALSLRYMGTGRQPSWWGKLADFSNPVLLITGEIDTKFVKINKQMKKQLQLSKLAVVKNAGHAIHVEQPEMFGKLVREFLFQIEKKQI